MLKDTEYRFQPAHCMILNLYF